ncbi:uncharacterized protein PAC_06650 [Phialocephala subalpina]|uniref:F-box domain-containing protein n=1 Tax=Phialocephala subalpina TaxID=576137 RepID=A0A1L7WVH8_9HELO|nr:uncharacterized protein PAC_06650 [Phialocephala subalpina]
MDPGKQPADMVRQSSDDKEVDDRSDTNMPTKVSISQTMPRTLATLPNDALWQICRFLNVCTMVCLGLTCKSLYIFIKADLPGAIDLSLHSCLEYTDAWLKTCACYQCTEDIYLGTLLQNFMGEKYQLYPGWDNVIVFLPKKYFGTLPPSYVKPKRWQRKRVNAFMGKKIGYRQSLAKGTPFDLIPNPFRAGKAWYRQAFRIISDDIERFDTVKEWEEAWGYLRFFVQHRKKLFDKVADDFMWRKFSEGLQLLGLHGDGV